MPMPNLESLLWPTLYFFAGFFAFPIALFGFASALEWLDEAHFHE